MSGSLFAWHYSFDSCIDSACSISLSTASTCGYSIFVCTVARLGTTDSLAQAELFPLTGVAIEALPVNSHLTDRLRGLPSEAGAQEAADTVTRDALVNSNVTVGDPVETIEMRLILPVQHIVNPGKQG